MISSHIYNLLNTIISRHCNIDIPITRNTHFHNDLGIDSLEKIEMMMDIEAFFAIIIPPQQKQSIATIGELMHFLQNRAKYQLV